MTQNYLPPPRSGFTEGRCPTCGKHTFSKGKINKHKCKGKERNGKEAQRQTGTPA